jgi:phosphatidylglycerophosphate synthase
MEEDTMFDTYARAVKDRVLRPIVLRVFGGVHPTAITTVSIIPGLAAAFLAAHGIWLWGVLCFLLNRILDGIDGLLARERDLQSDFGGYLDLLVDFVVYSAVPIGVWWGTGRGQPIALIVLLAVFYVNAASWMVLSAILEKRSVHASSSTTVQMPRGLVEGTETIVFFLVFFLIPSRSFSSFLAMAALTSVGIVQRIVWAYRRIR